MESGHQKEHEQCVVYALSSLKETTASRSAAMTMVGTMEGKNEIQDDLPCMLSSTITSNLQERDEPPSVSYDGSRKMNHYLTRSFILGNSGESKSYNDDDEHSGVWNTSTSMRTTYHTCRHRRPSSRRKGKEEVGIQIPPSLVRLNLVTQTLDQTCCISPPSQAHRPSFPFAHLAVAEWTTLAFEASYSAPLRRNGHPSFPLVRQWCLGGGSWYHAYQANLSLPYQRPFRLIDAGA